MKFTDSIELSKHLSSTIDEGDGKHQFLLDAATIRYKPEDDYPLTSVEEAILDLKAQPVYIFKGSVDYSTLPTSDVKTGWVYNLLTGSEDSTYISGDNVAAIVEEDGTITWDKLAATVKVESGILTINGENPDSNGNYNINGYLPLSAGPSYPLTGDLYTKTVETSKVAQYPGEFRDSDSIGTKSALYNNTNQIVNNSGVVRIYGNEFRPNGWSQLSFCNFGGFQDFVKNKDGSYWTNASGAKQPLYEKYEAVYDADGNPVIDPETGWVVTQRRPDTSYEINKRPYLPTYQKWNAETEQYDIKSTFESTILRDSQEWINDKHNGGKLSIESIPGSLDIKSLNFRNDETDPIYSNTDAMPENWNSMFIEENGEKSYSPAQELFLQRFNSIGINAPRGSITTKKLWQLGNKFSHIGTANYNPNDIGIVSKELRLSINKMFQTGSLNYSNTYNISNSAAPNNIKEGTSLTPVGTDGDTWKYIAVTEEIDPKTGNFIEKEAFFRRGTSEKPYHVKPTDNIVVYYTSGDIKMDLSSIGEDDINKLIYIITPSEKINIKYVTSATTSDEGIENTLELKKYQCALFIGKKENGWFLLSGGTDIDLSGYEKTSNKEDTLSKNSTNENYPSSKAVWDLIQSQKLQLSYQEISSLAFGRKQTCVLNVITSLAGNAKFNSYESVTGYGTTVPNTGFRYSAIIAMSYDGVDYGLYKIQVTNRGMADGGIFTNIISLANDSIPYIRPVIKYNSNKTIVYICIEMDNVSKSTYEEVVTAKYGIFNTSLNSTGQQILILNENLEYGRCYRIVPLNGNVHKELSDFETENSLLTGKYFNNNIKDIVDEKGTSLVNWNNNIATIKTGEKLNASDNNGTLVNVAVSANTSETGGSVSVTTTESTLTLTAWNDDGTVDTYSIIGKKI